MKEVLFRERSVYRGSTVLDFHKDTVNLPGGHGSTSQPSTHVSCPQFCVSVSYTRRLSQVFLGQMEIHGLYDWQFSHMMAKIYTKHSI